MDETLRRMMLSRSGIIMNPDGTPVFAIRHSPQEVAEMVVFNVMEQAQAQAQAQAQTEERERRRLALESRRQELLPELEQALNTYEEAQERLRNATTHTSGASTFENRLSYRQRMQMNTAINRAERTMNSLEEQIAMIELQIEQL